MKKSSSIVRKAVFPVAGLGTRFLPATKACPKEMLPVVDKPLIQYAVEEAYAAGIRQMIFVTGRNKRAIEDHFDLAYELQAELTAGGKQELAALVESIMPADMECVYIRQPRALGLGHAVLCAEHLIGDDPFAVLLADDLMVGRPPIMKQMVDIFAEEPSCILAVQDVPLSDTSKYGIVSGTQVSDDLTDISGLVEKPQPSVAPSTLAIAGRYILTSNVFECIRSQPSRRGSELQLTDGIAGLLAREKVYGYKYRGRRYDCGSKLGFLQANVDLGAAHLELGADFSRWLNSRCGR